MIIKISKFIKESNGTIDTYLGTIRNLQQIGQGGNSLVYSGDMNGKSVAVKFLTETNQSKITRFKAEFFNVTHTLSNKHFVKYINFQYIKVDDEIDVPIIIMKKYKTSLKSFLKNREKTEDELFRLFNFLCKSLNEAHKEGIIHRDIKPENILLTDKDEFVLTDFGIAYYNPDLYKLKADTKDGEKLANYEFSAPEQSKKGDSNLPTESMDIYAIGQICQWYCYNETHKGTHRKRLSELFNSTRVKILDSIVDRCICNDPEDRYKSIDQIIESYDKLHEQQKEIDPIVELELLSEAIRETKPTSYNSPLFIDKSYLYEKLIFNIKKKHFKRKLEFNTGRGNNSLNRLELIGDRLLLINEREIYINKIWLYTNADSYKDVILIEADLNEPYQINGEEHYHVAIINNGEAIVPSYILDSGFVEIGDKVLSTNEITIDYRCSNNEYKYIAIGTIYHSTILMDSDPHLESIQDKEIGLDEFEELINKIRRKKHRDLY